MTESRKASTMGLTISKTAYNNIKKLYYFSQFYFNGFDSVSFNDFLLMASVGYLSFEKSPNFETVGYPFGENTFVSVRVSEELKARLDGAIRNKLQAGSRGKMRSKTSESVSTVLEKLGTKEVMVVVLSLSYFISFINRNFGEIIDQGEKDAMVKRLRFPTVVKEFKRTLLHFFSEEFYDRIVFKKERGTEDDAGFIDQITAVFNSKYEEAHPESLKKYTNESLLQSFENIPHDIRSLSLLMDVSVGNSGPVKLESCIREFIFAPWLATDYSINASGFDDARTSWNKFHDAWEQDKKQSWYEYQLIQWLKDKDLNDAFSGLENFFGRERFDDKRRGYSTKLSNYDTSKSLREFFKCYKDLLPLLLAP